MRLKDKWRNRENSWALVTGSSSGIGLAIAEKLADLGYNLVLAGLDGAELKSVEKRVSEHYGIDVRAVEIDLARRESAGRLYEMCSQAGIAPSILVNNAGVFIYNDIVNTETDRIENMIMLHVFSVTKLSRLFGKDMAERGRGYILNISSYSMWIPLPGLALYGATKSYIRNFSISLAHEMKERGVTVTTILPAGVTTGLYGLSPRLQRVGKNLGILITPQRTAEVSLAAMFRGRKQYIPGVLMRLVLPIVKIMPGWVVRFIRRKTIQFQK